MSDAKPIYALRPVNVNGRTYKAGEEIPCGRGAWDSLLRTGRASKTKPKADKRQRPEARGQSGQGGGEPDEGPPSENNEGGSTALEVLGLQAQTVGTLAENEITTLEELSAYLEAEKQLSDLNGIGEATATKIVDAFNQYMS